MTKEGYNKCKKGCLKTCHVFCGERHLPRKRPAASRRPKAAAGGRKGKGKTRRRVGRPSTSANPRKFRKKKVGTNKKTGRAVYRTKEGKLVQNIKPHGKYTNAIEDPVREADVLFLKDGKIGAKEAKRLRDQHTKVLKIRYKGKAQGKGKAYAKAQGKGEAYAKAQEKAKGQEKAKAQEKGKTKLDDELGKTKLDEFKRQKPLIPNTKANKEMVVRLIRKYFHLKKSPKLIQRRIWNRHGKLKISLRYIKAVIKKIEKLG